MKLENKFAKWTLPKWKKELDKVFAIYIKERDGWKCFTCGRYAEGNGMQNGHYIPRGACGLDLYFSEENCHAQCYKCNHELEGNRHEYRRKLGEELHEKLYDKFYKDNSQKWSAKDYADKIELYKEKIKEIHN